MTSTTQQGTQVTVAASAVVLVTHDRDAAAYADDVITMQDGRIA